MPKSTPAKPIVTRYPRNAALTVIQQQLEKEFPESEFKDSKKRIETYCSQIASASNQRLAYLVWLFIHKKDYAFHVAVYGNKEPIGRVPTSGLQLHIPAKHRKQPICPVARTRTRPAGLLQAPQKPTIIGVEPVYPIYPYNDDSDGGMWE
jgi:hypothetical protein